MPQYTQFAQGTPCWIDLGSPDIAASMTFCDHLFGWDYDEAPPEEVGGQRYAWAKTSSGYPAGIYSRDDGEAESSSRPTWNVHLAVDDMNETIGRVEDCGGRVSVAPLNVGDVGMAVTITDLAGCTLNLWQPAGATR